MESSKVSKAQHMLLLLFFLFILLISAGCFDKGNNKDTGSYTLPTGTVTGIITSAEGTPLEGALVSIGACSSTTDVQGKFTITGVPPGTGLVLTVFLEGYVNYSVTIDVNKEQTVTLNFPMAALPPPPPPDDPDDPPGPPPPPAPGSVTGTVTENLLNRPRCGVVVTIGGLSATTDADGKFTINGVPAGNQAVTATLGGYKNYAGTVTVVSNGSVTKDLTLVQDCGRYVVFESAASNLVPGDTNDDSDIFLYDRQGGTTTRVSVAEDGTEGDDDSAKASISSDGRYVAFESDAGNLIPGDTNANTDVFVRDMVTGTLIRASVANDGSESSGSCYTPRISADGRYVVFQSWSSDLVPEAPSGMVQIYARDLQENTTILISKTPGGAEGNDTCYNPSVSADGRYVAFNSYATDLVPGGTSSDGHIFVRNLQSNTTVLASAADDGTQGDCWSDYPSISADGRYVTFESDAGNLVAGDTNGVMDIFIRDLQENKTTLASVSTAGVLSNNNSYYPSISAGGRYVSFSSDASNLAAGDTNGVTDIFIRDLQENKTTLASVSTAGVQTNNNSDYPSLSADGRYVAFQSTASSLVTGVPSGTNLIYLRDIQSGQTELASQPYQTCLMGNNGSDTPSVSDDGRYMVFASSANNLVAGDTNNYSDIFVTDLQTDTTTLVSVTTGGIQGNYHSGKSSTSGDGRYIAFESTASNLVAGDTNNAPDVFVRDLQTGTTTRVSVSTGGAEGIGSSCFSSISGNGRYVIFVSNASNLVAGDTNGNQDAFVRDLQAGTTTRVSLTSGGAEGNNGSYLPSISEDGRYAVFSSSSTNLVAGDTNGQWDIFVRDTVANTTVCASRSSAGIWGNGMSFASAVSDNGRYVVFESSARNLVVGDNNWQSDIFLRDTVANTTTRISTATDGTEGNGGSSLPTVSADGRYVTFQSGANNLVAGDTNGRDDVFIRDTTGNTTTLCSRNSAGAQGDSNSRAPRLSSDGRYVAFTSVAKNLTANDLNGTFDIFRHDQTTGSTILANPAVLPNITPNDDAEYPFTSYQDQPPILSVLRFLAGGSLPAGYLTGKLR